MESRNGIISISGAPVSGKSTTIKEIIKKLEDIGYEKEKIHLISTGYEFRKYFNLVMEFIKSLDDHEKLKELLNNDELYEIFRNPEYRKKFQSEIIKLKKKNMDKISIENANNNPELSEIRNIVDEIIDSKMRKLGEDILEKDSSKMNSENDLPNNNFPVTKKVEKGNLSKDIIDSVLTKDTFNEIWIIDSRLAFHNIPSSFAVRTIVDDNIAAQRLFNDKKRGKEDSGYQSIEEAKNAVLNRKNGEISRYKKRYGIDLENDDNYNLIIDTSYSNPKEIAEVILKCMAYDKDGRKYGKYWSSPKMFLPLQTERETLAKGSVLTFEETIESIKEHGYMPSSVIEVIDVDNVKYIIEGHHRNFANAYVGNTLIPYKVIAKDDEEVLPYGFKARTRAESCKTAYLYGHEEFIGKDFSYNLVYPNIYKKMKSLEER